MGCSIWSCGIFHVRRVYGFSKLGEPGTLCFRFRGFAEHSRLFGLDEILGLLGTNWAPALRFANEFRKLLCAVLA